MVGPVEFSCPRCQTTTVDDFFQPGTQPGVPGFEPIIASGGCTFCHANYFEDQDDYNEPWDAWTNSMMAQSTRDPVWHAALTIANQATREVAFLVHAGH